MKDLTVAKSVRRMRRELEAIQEGEKGVHFSLQIGDVTIGAKLSSLASILRSFGVPVPDVDNILESKRTRSRTVLRLSDNIEVGVEVK